MLNMRMLEKCIDSCVKGGYKYIGVKTCSNFGEKDSYSYAIYSWEDASDILEGFKLMYDEDTLKCKMNDRISIVGFTYGGTFEEIEKDLI